MIIIGINCRRIVFEVEKVNRDKNFDAPLNILIRDEFNNIHSAET